MEGLMVTFQSGALEFEDNGWRFQLQGSFTGSSMS